MKPARIFTALLIQETLDAMAIHDRTEEFGDCLIWTGASGEGGSPSHKPSGKPCTQVRRTAWHLAGNVLIARQPLVPTCRDKRCINPAHTKQSTTAKVAQDAASRGMFSTLKRRAAIAAGSKHRRKLSDEGLADIKASTESGPVLAARHGVNRSLVTRIRANAARIDYKNPYLALMA